MERGTVTSWKEDKKFGFIKTATSGREVFFHISDLKRGSRIPCVGEMLEFDIRSGSNGKIRAANIYFCNDIAERKRAFTTMSVLLLIIPCIGCILSAVYGSYLPVAAYLIATPLSFYAYKDDKWKAKNRQWRTPEATLHLLDLLGGWYGGFYAQRKLYHKNKKGPFQVVFWLTVIAHLSIWIYVIVNISRSYFST